MPAQKTNGGFARKQISHL